MKLTKTLFIFTSFLSLQFSNIIANETLKKEDLPEYAQYIPIEILFACEAQYIRACDSLLMHFYCAYKTSKGNLTQGEKHLRDQENKKYSNENEYLTRLITIILEDHVLPEKIAELVDKTLISKRKMQRDTKNNK